MYLMFKKRNKKEKEKKFHIEIDNDERGVIGNFTMISDIRITKADLIANRCKIAELGVVYFYSNMTF